MGRLRDVFGVKVVGTMVIDVPLEAVPVLNCWTHDAPVPPTVSTLSAYVKLTRHRSCVWPAKSTVVWPAVAPLSQRATNMVVLLLVAPEPYAMFVMAPHVRPLPDIVGVFGADPSWLVTKTITTRLDAVVGVHEAVKNEEASTSSLMS